MSLGHGAKIVRDGLIFAYDMGNKKSWKATLSLSSYDMVINSALGTEYNQFKLDTFTFYNRALPSDEVKQNFNALRGRFGI